MSAIKSVPLKLRLRLFCPKCNKIATFYSTIKVTMNIKSGVKVYNYIVLGHYSVEDKRTHRWCFAPLSDDNLRFITSLGIERGVKYVTLEGKDLEEFVKLVSLFDVEGCNVPSNLKLLGRMVKSAKKIVVRVYR